MRTHYVVLPLLAAALAALMATPAGTVGRPGITPVACPGPDLGPPRNPRSRRCRARKRYFGTYDGGLYRIEIPDKWNGELDAERARLRVERRARRARACASATRPSAST